MKDAGIRTPRARVRGLGAARSGTTHFWHERLTSVALVPLTIGFVLVLLSLLGSSHAVTVRTLGSPLVAIVMLLFIVTGAYHMKLGMQVIIEDYVHDEGLKLTLLIANIFFSVAVGLTCVYAILKVSSGV